MGTKYALLGGKVEDSIESKEMSGELVCLGGVRPRVTSPCDDSGVLGGGSPRMDLLSEEDRSLGAGLWENSRRNVAPRDEASFRGRVSSFLESIKFKFGGWSRTIPEDGTADNLSMTGASLVGDRFGWLATPGPLESLSSSGALVEETILLIILTIQCENK